MCLFSLACFARTVCFSSLRKPIVYDLVSFSEDRLVKTAGTADLENFSTKKLY